MNGQSATPFKIPQPKIFLIFTCRQLNAKLLDIINSSIILPLFDTMHETLTTFIQIDELISIQLILDSLNFASFSEK